MGGFMQGRNIEEFCIDFIFLTSKLTLWVKPLIRNEVTSVKPRK
eukprot:UN17245